MWSNKLFIKNKKDFTKFLQRFNEEELENIKDDYILDDNEEEWEPKEYPCIIIYEDYYGEQDFYIIYKSDFNENNSNE